MASSTTPAHIEIALDEGVEAGFDAFYNSLVQNTNDGTNGLPQLRTLLADVKKVGKKRGRGVNRSKQIAFYCNKYADFLDEADDSDDEPTTEVETTTTTTTTDVSALIIAAVQAGATPEQIAAIVAGSNGSVVTVTEDEIEADEPETCPPFTGKNPDDDASSGQLYSLNALGLLTPHFTKAEAHEAIWTAKNA